MSKPVFSLIAPSVRSAYYQQVYDSIARDAKVPFEFIFVGNVEPLKKIADNFHYINTNVKPAQCVEIAARNATGDFLIPIADDITFSDNFLNTILKNINSNPEKVFSFNLLIDGKINDNFLYWHIRKSRDKLVGASGVFERKMWNDLGGVDSRFIYINYDKDIMFRYMETKDLVIIPECFINENRYIHKSSRRASSVLDAICERDLFNSLWVNDDKKVSSKRLKKVNSFDDKDILIKSQGRNIESIWE